MKYFILILSIVLTTSSYGQDLIKWYTWEEGMAKADEESKKLFVDIYTNWCGYCKKMDKATFQNPVIAEYMNEHYIAIKFNAEQREDLTFKGVTHKYMKAGRRGYNTLAIELTKGNRLSYPTVVFLDEQKNVIQAIPGFLDPPTFDPIIRYFAQDLHHQMPWASYLAQYKNAEKAVKDKNARLVKGN